MLKFVWFLLCGFASGILGGMGMGGGTVLIPLLTLFFGVAQHTAQAVNLISFIPMAVCALVVHTKNGLVKKEKIWFIIIPALIFGVGFSLIAKIIKADALQKAFGIFLLVLSVFQFFQKEE